MTRAEANPSPKMNRHARILGRLGQITGCLGCVGFFLQPQLIRYQSRAKYSDFLDQDAIDQVVAIQIEETSVHRWMVLILSIASMILGTALLKGKAWATWAWICLCVCWVGHFSVGQSWSQMPATDVMGLGFRSLVLLYSFCLLKKSAPVV